MRSHSNRPTLCCHLVAQVGRWFVAVSMLLAAGPLLASSEAEDLADKSLAELMQFRVITPTSSEERAIESPSVVSVLTSSQIENLGVTTLYEALNYLPGVQVTESYWGYTMINMRGLLQVHYNNRVLLMINGHPTREVVNGSFHLELVPISAVDRIELVRGPGSALYGTNAFGGVINIITKMAGDPEANRLDIGAGSFGTVEGSAIYSQTSDDFELMVALSTRSDSGYTYDIEEDERGQSATLDYENDVVNGMVVLKVHDFTLTLAAFDQTKSKFGITPVIDWGGSSTYKQVMIDLAWQREIASDLTLSTRLRYDHSDRRAHVTSFPFDGFAGHDNADTTHFIEGSLWGGDINIKYTGSDRFSFLGGAEYQHRDAEPYVFRFDDDDSVHPLSAFLNDVSGHDVSVYAQGLVQISDKLEAVLGVRYNDDSRAGSTFVPRIGMVYELASDTFLKVLYAEAYRTPDFFEQEVATFNVLFGDTDLEPERTRNLDVAVDTNINQLTMLQVNAFWLTTSNLLLRVPTSDPELHGPDAAIYVNSGGEEIWGFEAGLVSKALPSCEVFANYSFRDGQDRSTDDDLRFIANHTLNLGLVWRVTPNLEVKPNLQTVSHRGEVDSYTLVNLVLTAHLGANLELDFIGRNLSDEDYDYPEYIRRVIDRIPGGPERSFLVRVRWNY